MIPLYSLIIITTLLLAVAAAGYVLSVLKEKMDLYHDQVHIPSRRLTQHDIDGVDLKAFRVGRVNLMIGDRIKVYLKDSSQVRGTVLGARKKDNSLCLVTPDDELVTLSVATIRRLKVLDRYGKLF